MKNHKQIRLSLGNQLGRLLPLNLNPRFDNALWVKLEVGSPSYNFWSNIVKELCDRMLFEGLT